MNLNLDVDTLINKARSQAVNIIIILLAVLIAFNNYKTKAGNRILLKDTLNTELRKNEVFLDISKLEKRFMALKNRVNNKAVSLVIDKLGNMAKECEVKITLIRPKSEINLGIYTKYPFELNVSAKSYHGLGKFISRIESSSDIYSVENMVITSEFKGAKNMGLTTKLLLSTILIN